MNLAATLAHPEWVAPLAAVVLGAAVLLAATHARARRRLRGLLGRNAPRPRIVPDLVLVAALLATAVALAGPRVGMRTVRVPATGVDVVILFDVSRSMDATDTPPSRIARARRIADGVLAGLAPGDRAALAVFADHGALLTPLTADHEALRELVPAIDTELMTDAGSRIWTGLRAAVPAYDPAGLRPRELLVLSDGERSRGTPTRVLDRLVAAQVRVVTVGIGSEAGSTIPTPIGELRDLLGEPVVSRRDLSGLEGIARATGGAALAADRFGSIGTRALLAELHRDAHPVADGTLERRVPVPRHALPAAVALVLLLAEGLPSRLRASRGPAARAWRRRAAPGAALAVLLVLSLGAAPEAKSGAAPDVAALERRVAERPEDVRSLVALGVAQARGGDREEARRTFLAALVQARRPAEAATAYYDLGVAALEDQQFAAARDAFLDAIAVDPTDRRAKWNLEWTLRALRRAPPPPGASPKRSPAREEPRKEQERSRTAPPPPARAPGAAGGADKEPSAATEGRPKPGGTQSRPGERGAGGGSAGPRLDPQAARRWLDAVEDDAGRAFQAAARRGSPSRRSLPPGPRW